MPEPRSNVEIAGSDGDTHKLVVAVFSTPQGQALLTKLEEKFIYSRRADVRNPNIGYENEGSADVVRFFRNSIKQETRRHGS